MPINPSLDYKTATIAASGTTSGEVDLQGGTLVGIHLSAALTGTALTLQAASVSGGTFQGVFDGGSAVSYTVAGGRYLVIDPTKLQGLRFIKVVSGSAEAAERVLTLVTKAF